MNCTDTPAPMPSVTGSRRQPASSMATIRTLPDCANGLTIRTRPSRRELDELGSSGTCVRLLEAAARLTPLAPRPSVPKPSVPNPSEAACAGSVRAACPRQRPCRREQAAGHRRSCPRAVLYAGGFLPAGDRLHLCGAQRVAVQTHVVDVAAVVRVAADVLANGGGTRPSVHLLPNAAEGRGGLPDAVQVDREVVRGAAREGHRDVVPAVGRGSDCSRPRRGRSRRPPPACGPRQWTGACPPRSGRR